MDSTLPSPWVIGQTHPIWQLPWTDTDGAAVDLTGATLTATIKAEGASASALMKNTPTVFATNPGIVRYVVHATEVAAPGTYLVQFVAAFADTTVSKAFSGVVDFVASN
jgi:hypothetical protein